MKKEQKMMHFQDKRKFLPEKPYVIICEGADEYFFMIAYLDYLEKTEQLFQDCHNVIDFGGTNDVGKGIDDIKIYPHYEDMKGFLIIRDAEADAVAASTSLQDHIKRTWGIELDASGRIQTDSEGVKVGFCLLPGINEDGHFRNGTLEDLCLDIITDAKEPIAASNLLPEVDDYVYRIQEKRGAEMRHLHKNKLYLYLSSTDTFVGSKVGEAAKYGAFDLNSDKLAYLKDLILQMQD